MQKGQGIGDIGGREQKKRRQLNDDREAGKLRRGQGLGAGLGAGAQVDRCKGTRPVAWAVKGIALVSSVAPGVEKVQPVSLGSTCNTMQRARDLADKGGLWRNCVAPHLNTTSLPALPS